MRIQGVHLKDLRIPPGEQQLGFDAGYNVVLAGQAGPLLLRLLLSLLYPGLLPQQPRPPGEAEGAQARAILGFADRSGNYRVVADLARGRVALARYGGSDGRYERVALDAVGVAERLRALGLPALQDFLELNAVGWAPIAAGAAPLCGPDAAADPAAATSPAGAGGAAHEPGAAPEAEPELEDFDLEEAKCLAALRERAWGAEQELGHLRRELAETSWLLRLAAAPDFERRLGRLQALQEAHAQARAAQELARNELLEERARLCGRSAALRPFGLGLAIGTALVLGVAAATASGLRELAPYAALGTGLVWAGALALRAGAQRRRLVAVDDRLVSLRLGQSVRGGSLPPELHELGQALAERALGIEEVRRLLATQRQQQRRCEELELELGAAKRLLTPERLRWLASCERALTGRRSRAAAPPAADELEQPPAVLERRCTDPAALLAVAAACAKCSLPELEELLAPVLPLYVRALTGGRYGALRELEDGSWCAERLEPRAELALAGLAGPLRARLQLALQLALLEVLAPGARTPVLVGPELGCSGEEDARILARALARLGAVRQVLHCCAQPGPFSENAHRVQRLVL